MGAAHHDDPLHPLDDAGLLADGKRDVRVRADGHERDRPGIVRQDGVDDEVHGMAFVEVERRGGQHGPVEPGIAVDLDGQNLIAYHRTG